MKTFNTLVIIVLIGTLEVGNALSPPVCQENEIYDDCRASACQETCTNKDQLMLMKCACVAGCICKDENYVRNPDIDGPCIPREECPSECGENEVPTEDGAACQNTCTDRSANFRPCQRLKGCICAPGYIRVSDTNRTCIKTTCCPQCPPNYIKNAQGECVCRPGYQLKLWKCEPIRCGSNEYFTTTGVCEATCRLGRNPIAASGKCRNQCICKSGFARNPETGKCIPSKDCPKCPENEIFNACGTACEADCNILYEPPEFCTMDCVPGCFCRKGYVRDFIGHCISVKDCPKCGKNEKYSPCNAGCQRTCLNRDKVFACPAICREGCVCKNGFIRSNAGACIPETKCP